MIYVDDINLLATDPNVLEWGKDTLKDRFHLKDMVIVRWYLGMTIIDNPKGISRNQGR